MFLTKEMSKKLKTPSLLLFLEICIKICQGDPKTSRNVMIIALLCGYIFLVALHRVILPVFSSAFRPPSCHLQPVVRVVQYPQERGSPRGQPSPVLADSGYDHW